MPKRLIGMYRGYSPKDTEEHIRAHFLERYGYEPEVVQHSGGGWAAGPIHGATEMRTGEHILTGTLEVTDA